MNIKEKIKELIILTKSKKKDKVKMKTSQKIVIGICAVVSISVVGVMIVSRLSKRSRKKLKNQVIDTVEAVNDTVKDKTETLKDSAVHATQKIHKDIEDSCEKSEGVKKDIVDKYNEIAEDIHKTAENILDETKSYKIKLKQEVDKCK